MLEEPDAYGSWWAVLWAVRTGRTPVREHVMSRDETVEPECPERQRGLWPGAAPASRLSKAVGRNNLVALKYPV